MSEGGADSTWKPCGSFKLNRKVLIRSLTGVTSATVAVWISFSRGSVAVRFRWLNAVLVALADLAWAVPLSEALRMTSDLRLNC